MKLDKNSTEKSNLELKLELIKLKSRDYGH